MTPAMQALATSMTLLTPGEVAGILRVNPKTLSRWVREGRIPAITLPGGARRFQESTILNILTGDTP